MVGVALFAASCQEDYQPQIDDIKAQLSTLASKVDAMNSSISALQTTVSAMANNVTVKNVATTDNGCVITFSDGKSVTITNGKDGATAPVIGVKEVNGVYYWTLTANGETNFLLDGEGNKIPVAGAAGENGENGGNGQDGQDGVTPLIKIDDNGYWAVSYDKGETWETLKDKDGNPVSAKGSQGVAGADGKDGDSFFKGVEETDDFVIVTLMDGTAIRLHKEKALAINFDAFETFINPEDTVIISYSVSGLHNGQKATVKTFANAPLSAKVMSDSTIRVICGQNLEAEDEAEVVVFVSDGEERTIISSINMMTGAIIKSSGDYIVMPAKGGDFDFEFVTNMEFEVKVLASWITEPKATKAMNDTSFSYVCEKTPSNYERQGHIKVYQKGTENVIYDFTVVQEGGVYNTIAYTSLDSLDKYDANVVYPKVNTVSGIVNSQYVFGNKIFTLADNSYDKDTDYGTLTYQYGTPGLYHYDFLDVQILKIGDTFRGNTDVTSVTIPDSVTEISSKAFEGCTSLRFVKFVSEKAPRMSYTAFPSNMFFVILVPKDSFFDYYNMLHGNVRIMTY